MQAGEKRQKREYIKGGKEETKNVGERERRKVSRTILEEEEKLIG